MYVGLVLALFVRFGPAPHASHPLRLEAAPADLRLVRRHHRVFYAILLASPLEWWLRGRPADARQLGAAALFLAGLAGYRRAGRTLGLQLTPLLAPREPAVLTAHGPYRRVRHPMYLAELVMAFAAPLVLGARLSVALAAAFAVVVVQRMGREERILTERMPGYREYAARTHRLLPYVY